MAEKMKLTLNEDEESQSLSDAHNLVQELTESEAENVTVHTNTSPGEAVEPQQQVQTEDTTTDARCTQTDIINDDQRIMGWIANCPTNPKHSFIFKNLKTFKWGFHFGLITEDKLEQYVTNFKLGARRMDGGGGRKEGVKELLQCITFGGNPKDFNKLEQDLLKRLSGKDPVKRIKKALLHPIFWSESRKLEFIRRVANQKEVKRQYFPYYIDTKEFCNWKYKINRNKPGLVKEMEKERAKYNMKNAPYPENLFGLLLFIRNYLEHRADVAVEINFTLIFPDLFEKVYMLAKEKDWISKPYIQSLMTDF